MFIANVLYCLLVNINVYIEVVKQIAVIYSLSKLQFAVRLSSLPISDHRIFNVEYMIVSKDCARC